MNYTENNINCFYSDFYTTQYLFCTPHFWSQDAKINQAWPWLATEQTSSTVTKTANDWSLGPPKPAKLKGHYDTFHLQAEICISQIINA
jgi:hypothetical protein